MKQATYRKIGIRLLVAGVVMLVVGIAGLILTDSVITAFLLSGSILVNTAGITFYRQGRDGSGKE